MAIEIRNLFSNSQYHLVYQYDLQNNCAEATTSHLFDRSVKRVLADGIYDSNKNFRYLSKNHIKPAIKTRRNSQVKSTNCYARNMSVLRQQTNLKRWKRSMGYGQMWMAETVFSCIKRMFGEYVNARKFHNISPQHPQHIPHV